MDGNDSGIEADPYDLHRFIAAQEGVYDLALLEIKSGRKKSHWMWYVFPQYAGLGFSAASKRFAINSIAEAQAYLRHPLLGPRLLKCAEAVVGIDKRTATDIFGTPDDLKLRSSATLFASVSPPNSIFARVLDKYFQGVRDEKTLRWLGIDGTGTA